MKRTRLPSPAMGVAITALFVALGGTGYAATTLTTQSTTATVARKQKPKPPANDNKSDTALVNQMAPGLSVNFAKSAGSAANASHATNADSASNASYAANASHSTTAGSAPPSGAASGGLSGNYPNPTIAANAVSGANVVDHSLNGAKITEAQGTRTYDVGTLAAGACNYDAFDAGLANNAKDVYLVNPSDTSFDYTRLVVGMSPSNTGPSWVRLKVCNPTGASLTPGSEVFNWAAITVR